MSDFLNDGVSTGKIVLGYRSKSVTDLFHERENWSCRLDSLKKTHRTLKSDRLRNALEKAFILSLSTELAVVRVNSRGDIEIGSSFQPNLFEDEVYYRFEGNYRKSTLEKISLRMKKAKKVDEALEFLHKFLETKIRESQRMVFDCEQRIELEKHRAKVETEIKKKEEKKMQDQNRKKRISSLIEEYKAAMKIKDLTEREKVLSDIREETARVMEKAK